MSSTLGLEMIQRELLLNQLTFNLNQSVSVQQEAAQMLSQVNNLSSFEQVQSVLQQINLLLNTPPTMHHLNTQISLTLHHNQIASILSSSISFQNQCSSPAQPQILNFENKNTFTDSKSITTNNDFTQNFKPMMNSNSQSRSQIGEEKTSSPFNSFVAQFPSVDKKFSGVTSKFTVNNQFVDTLQKISDNFSNSLQMSETTKFPCFPEKITENTNIINKSVNKFSSSSPTFTEFNRTETKNTQDTSFDTNTHDAVVIVDSPSFTTKQLQIRQPKQESLIQKVPKEKHTHASQPVKKVIDTSPESIEHMFKMYTKGLRSINTMYNLQATDILFDRDFFEKRILNKGMPVLPYFKYKDQEYIKRLYEVLGTTQKKIALLLHLPNRSVGKIIGKYNRFNLRKSLEAQKGSKEKKIGGKRIGKNNKDESCYSSQYSSQEEKDSSEKRDSFENRNNNTQTNSSVNEEEEDDELGYNEEEEEENNDNEEKENNCSEGKDETDEFEGSNEFNRNENNNEAGEIENSQEQLENGWLIDQNQGDSKEGQENEFINNYQADILAAVKKVEMERRNQAQKEQNNQIDSDNQRGLNSMVKIEDLGDNQYKRLVKIIKPSNKGNIFSQL